VSWQASLAVFIPLLIFAGLLVQLVCDHNRLSHDVGKLYAIVFRLCEKLDVGADGKEHEK